MKNWKFAAIVGALGLSVAANATFYTTEASFLAAIDPVYYLEDFNTLDYGDVFGDPSWAAPGGNGYGWTATAPPDGVFSNQNSMSTNASDEDLIITFSGLPVSAFGGILNNANFDGDPQGGTVTLMMSNGDTMSVADGSFLGWVGNSSVTNAHISAAGMVQNWAQLDHAYTGAKAATVPEPASLAVIALGAFTMLRRRNKK